jgi:DNA-binding CsgD family transcriptional regulator
MWVGCPVNADVESGFIFDRLERSGKGGFTADDQERAAFLLQGINWFHRRLVLSRGITAGRSPCTPAERKTLALLLTGKTEKEIADALGVSLHTTHARITTIYRKFGVKGRAELMALWL